MTRSIQRMFYVCLLAAAGVLFSADALVAQEPPSATRNSDREQINAILQGWEGHAEVHRTVFRNSVQRERLEELTFVGPDAAVVRFCSTLTGDERAPEKLIRSRKILIVTRREGDWKIGWGQNTRFQDSAPDAAACSKSR
jgi:ketosteroid isomerase-like protein